MMNLLQRIDALEAKGNGAMVKAVLISQLDEDRFLNPMRVASILKHIQSRAFFEKDNGYFTAAPQKMWTPDYWVDIRVALLNNFSFEKLEHCVCVMQFLRSNNEVDFLSTERRRPKTRQEVIHNPGIIDNVIGAYKNGWQRGRIKK